MDEERLRKELQERAAANGGDVLAAASEMLDRVIEDVEALPNGWQEIIEADELLELESPKHKRQKGNSSEGPAAD
jgi:hypothetical protein